MAHNPRALIAQLARARGLDPRAVLAVAAQEGLGGGIGDNGTSFGPFQLHIGGAYPSSAPRGARASQAWAWSPEGLRYALDRIASVAQGLHGRQAVQAIVSQFERPANPGGEIARALAAYGSGAGGLAGSPSSGARTEGQNPGLSAGPAPAPPDLHSEITSALMAQVGQKHPDYQDVFGLLHTQNATPGSSGYSAGPPSNAAAGQTSHPAGGGDPLAFLTALGQRFGDTVTSSTGGKHVPGSYHYQGRAEDFAGSSSQMGALMRYALAHPAQFVEAFYDPAGYYVKNGKVVKGSIGGHSDHVHLAR